MRRFAQVFSSCDGFPRNFGIPLSRALSSTPDRYNIGVRKPASVLLQADGETVVRESIWGIVPRWSKEPSTPYTTVTARLDRAPRSRIYRHAWENQRCVVPMTGYYKWDRTVKPPVPYFIQSTTGEVLFVAGLWESWEKSEPHLFTFTLLTHPNPAIPAPLVPDGPVFLPPDQWKKWLSGAQWFPGLFLKHVKPPRLEAYAVSRAIRDPQRDDYTLLEPADPLELAPDSDAALQDEMESDESQEDDG